MHYIIKTNRLGLRKWRNADLKSLIEINTDPDTMRYFPKKLSGEETRQQYNRILNHFKEFDYGWFAVDYLLEKRFIGFIGIAHQNFPSDFTPCVEIGWRLDKSYWNKGLATVGLWPVWTTPLHNWESRKFIHLPQYRISHHNESWKKSECKK